jgi:hypothetical protein
MSCGCAERREKMKQAFEAAVEKVKEVFTGKESEEQNTPPPSEVTE